MDPQSCHSTAEPTSRAPYWCANMISRDLWGLGLGLSAEPLRARAADYGTNQLGSSTYREIRSGFVMDRLQDQDPGQQLVSR